MIEIINKSLETAIEKIKNINKCEEFGPINSIKAFEKVLETVVKQQPEKYIEENKLSLKYLPGFRRTFSCETAVIYVASRWKNAKNNKILGICLDFRRVFERIGRNILLQKLLKYWIESEELVWFRSYLTNLYKLQELKTVNPTQLKISMEHQNINIRKAVTYCIH